MRVVVRQGFYCIGMDDGNKEDRGSGIRARAGVANMSEKKREARPRWLGHVERKSEEDVVLRIWMWVYTEI